MKTPETFYRFLASKGFAVVLFLLLCVVLIPGTLAETREISLGLTGSIIVGLMALNLALCTLQRLKSLSKPVLVMHIGTLLVIGGAVAGSKGFVATVNIYEGSTVDTVYRWDLKKDMPLGVDLTVKQISLEYYPAPVKVGVLREGKKVGLFTMKTGEDFQLKQYKVRVDALELPAENLRMSIFSGDRLIGSADTEGWKDLPPDFPYEFVLVAFRKPSLKQAGVDLVISKKSQIIAEGKSEVNSPLTWESLSFYNTSYDVDDHGLRYAGIQITNDPGRPFVYAGFAVMGLGSAMYFLGRLRKARK